jgi:D-alanine transaminase
MSRIVYVNGSYVSEEQGKISIFDRGFLFADGIYEVTAVVNAGLVDYDAHMERLERSLREIRLDWPCSKELAARRAHALDGGLGNPLPAFCREGPGR